jgi:hypothetical protein
MKFVNEQGKILPRRITGTSLKYQRKVSQAIKRARHIGVLPYVSRRTRISPGEPHHENHFKTRCKIPRIQG